MHWSQVTIVIPLYNKRATVGRAIDSVLSQKCSAEKLIVVDDGSSDGSAEFVKERYPKICLVQQSNAGVSAARNRGVAEAITEYVAFLDADDWWDEEALMTLAGLAKKYPEAGLCAVSHFRVDGKSLVEITSGLNGDKCLDRRQFIQLYSRYSGLLNSSSVCAKRSVLLSIGGFPEKYDNGEDVHVWLSLSLCGFVAVSPGRHVYVDRPSGQFGRSKGRRTLPAYVALLGEGQVWKGSNDGADRILKRFLRVRALKQMLGFMACGQRALAWATGRKVAKTQSWFMVVTVLVMLIPRRAVTAAYWVKQRVRSRRLAGA